MNVSLQTCSKPAKDSDPYRGALAFSNSISLRDISPSFLNIQGWCNTITSIQQSGGIVYCRLDIELDELIEVNGFDEQNLVNHYVSNINQLSPLLRLFDGFQVNCVNNRIPETDDNMEAFINIIIQTIDQTMSAQGCIYKALRVTSTSSLLLLTDGILELPSLDMIEICDILEYQDSSFVRIQKHFPYRVQVGPEQKDIVVFSRKPIEMMRYMESIGPLLGPFATNAINNSSISHYQSSLPRSPSFTRLVDTRQLLGRSPSYDRAATAWWGWIILLGTWIVFISGIGSMFGIWKPTSSSFRQDFGSYAAYEKISGFPIIQYYPCLILLTFVSAWIWCITSWMGLKFFRHAKGGISKNY